MKRRPSAATAWAPDAFLKKIGSPPTPRNARTGEFTPPGMYLQASWNRLVTSISHAQYDLETAVRAIARPRRPAMGFHDLRGDGEPDSLAAAAAVARFGGP